MNKRPPEELPEPWLFNSESLLRELDRCRELVLQIPAKTHEVHFASNIAIDAIWNPARTAAYAPRRTVKLGTKTSGNPTRPRRKTH